MNTPGPGEISMDRSQLTAGMLHCADAHLDPATAAAGAAARTTI